jgi:hypothetical protein
MSSVIDLVLMDIKLPIKYGRTTTILKKAFRPGLLNKYFAQDKFVKITLSKSFFSLTKSKKKRTLTKFQSKTNSQIYLANSIV